MRSPSRLGKPALGMPLTRSSSTAVPVPAECGSKRLRAESAICADDLNVFALELRGGIGGAEVAESSAFFGVGELRDDGQTGKRANRVDGEEQFFDVGKSFEDVEIDAALFKSERLLVKDILNFFGRGMAGLHAEAERADGTGDEDFAGADSRASRAILTPRLLRR